MYNYNHNLCSKRVSEAAGGHNYTAGLSFPSLIPPLFLEISMILAVFRSKTLDFLTFIATRWRETR